MHSTNQIFAMIHNIRLHATGETIRNAVSYFRHTWGQNRPEVPVAYKCGIQDLGNSVASVTELAIRPDTYVLSGKT